MKRTWKLKSWVQYVLFLMPVITYFIAMAITRNIEKGILTFCITTLITTTIIYLTGSLFHK